MKEHLHNLQDELNSLGIPFEIGHPFELPSKERILLSLTNLGSGFYSPEDKIVFLTSKELFNEKVRVGRFDSRFKEGTILKSYEDLTPGDYVVHERYGIGISEGIETMNFNGKEEDYYVIMFKQSEIM